MCELPVDTDQAIVAKGFCLTCQETGQTQTAYEEERRPMEQQKTSQIVKADTILPPHKSSQEIDSAAQTAQSIIRELDTTERQGSAQATELDTSSPCHRPSENSDRTEQTGQGFSPQPTTPMTDIASPQAPPATSQLTKPSQSLDKGPAEISDTYEGIGGMATADQNDDAEARNTQENENSRPLTQVAYLSSSERVSGGSHLPEPADGSDNSKAKQDIMLHGIEQDKSLDDSSKDGDRVKIQKQPTQPTSFAATGQSFQQSMMPKSTESRPKDKGKSKQGSESDGEMEDIDLGDPDAAKKEAEQDREYEYLGGKIAETPNAQAPARRPSILDRLFPNR